MNLNDLHLYFATFLVNNLLFRNVLAMNPTIEDKWEVRFSNERQTNNPKPIVLLTGTRKQSQSYYPDPSFKMETPKSIL